MKPRISLRRLFLTAGSLALIAGLPAAQDDAARRLPPDATVVRITSPDGKPVPDCVIRIGARSAATSADGTLVLDGIPAGTYRLVIDEMAFDKVDRQVDLPSGKRSPIDIVLAPVTAVPVRGQVMSEEGFALAGARIVLTPAAVAASCQGRIDFSSHWDGKFALRPIPAGRYRAEVSTAGCATKTFDVDVKPDMPELSFKLSRESRPADLRVEVRDSVSGRPIPDASVTLAEAWPKGKIAEGRSDSAGTAHLRALQVGRLNWMDKEGALTIARRHATLRVEAAGYEAAIAMAALDPASTVTVVLNPAVTIAEQEPNNAVGAAQAIRTGTPVELAISSNDDADFFSFRLRFPARLRVVVGPGNPIETLLRLYDREGRVIRESGAYANQENVVNAVPLPAGDYFVSVHEWGNNNASKTPMTLRADVESAPDPMEPNDTPGAARLLQSGEEVRGCIEPVGDLDYYRFELKRAAWVRLTVAPNGLERCLNILNEAGAGVGTAGAYSGQPIDLVVQLAAGSYVAQMSEWGNNAESPEPYSLRLETSADDGIDDPPAARTLEAGTLVGSTINPIGDIDRFAIPIPGPGVLVIAQTASTELYSRLRDAKGNLLAEGAIYSEQAGQYPWFANGPTLVFLEVGEWGNNHWSPCPYLIRTSFKPCDELEAMGRNEVPAAALPVELLEPIRGSIFPWGDQDWYKLAVDHPGFLVLEGVAPTEIFARLRNHKNAVVAEGAAYANQALRLEPEVAPGEYFIEITEWGNNACSLQSYRFTPRLLRAEAAERVPLADDPIRLLKPGEAQPFAIDHVGERDRFVFDIPDAGRFSVKLRTRLETYIVLFDDRSGQKLHDSGHYAEQSPKLDFEAKGPTRYRLEISEWGNNNRSLEPGYVLVDTQDRPIVAEKIEATIDPLDPTWVSFARKESPGTSRAAKVSLDADGDGRTDLNVPAEGVRWRYAAEGTYAVTAFLEGDNGARGIARTWVEAVGPHERKGIFVVMDHPAEGQVLERDEPCRVRAVSYTGAKIAGVSLSVDDRPTATAYSAPFELDVPWKSLSGGRHTLTVTVSDARGERAVLRREVRVSEYFDLQPEDGAVQTGNDVRVSWSSGVFGPARARYRVKGEADWKEAVGESGRERLVALSGLEPGRAYEFQPIGAGEAGPLRTVTRVKGLAFGKSRYGANIARDYDQRAGISVRNHADKPMVVRLECGKSPDPALLVGFVGEGSEGAPFTLQPGEEREFMLGISAQDVKTAAHKFPIRIASESGYSDQADVELNVKLPDVKLEWQEVGPAPSGLGRVLRLTNKGDTLTDLDLVSLNADLSLSPSIRHGTFPAGGILEINAIPRLFEGFSGVEAKIEARAVDKIVSTEVKIAVGEGKKVIGVQLVPGYDPEAAPSEEADILTARAMAGAHLNPAVVDWSKKEDPQDTDNDGKSDRWSVWDAVDRILWVGDDSDGDGEIDFTHADIGRDGQFDYSAFKGKDGWEETNLVEAWLEMGFALPWARSAYEKHDADVVMNGRVVGRLRDSIPEGNYTFRIPPDVLLFGESGMPEGNEIEIQSKHLRGGHYVISSDFRIKLRLTGTRVWVVAGGEDEARKAARKQEGLSLEGCDYSVSSSELTLDAPQGLKKGAPVTVAAVIRNVGAARTRSVGVALMIGEAELTRAYATDVPLTGGVTVQLSWTAGPGAHTLKVVLDPDGETPDVNRDNNVAMIPVTVPGDDAKPTVKIVEPRADATFDDPKVKIVAEAADDAGIARMEYSIDQGLWRPMKDGAAFTLVQPGTHVVAVRATDSSGNPAVETVRFSVVFEVPPIDIVDPPPGQSLDEAETPVTFKVPEDTAVAGARVNGGPWRQAKVKNGVAETKVPVPFGKGKIDTMAANKKGVRSESSREVDNRRQRKPEDPPFVDPPAESREGVVDVDGVGPVDFFAPGGPKAVEPALERAVASRPPPPDTPPNAVRPAGGFVGVQRKQSDWYCTNRPNIKVKFQLPDWLKRKNLPKPGTEEYRRMITRLLTDLQMRGFSTKALEQFQAAMERRCKGLQGPHELPGFFESLGLDRPKSYDPAELERWRQSMLEKSQAWWLRLLASGDPRLIAEGLKARGEALGQFDKALQDSADAVVTEVNANQKITDDVLNALPFVGDAMDIVALYRGETLAGEKMTALSYVLTGAGLLGPAALGKLMENKGAREVFEGLAEMTSNMTSSGKKALCNALGMNVDKLDEGLEAIGKVLTKERHILKQDMDEAAEQALKKFANSADGVEDLARAARDTEAGQKVVKELKEALEGGDPEQIKKALQAWQSDKTAQAILLTGKNLPPGLAKEGKEGLEQMWKKTKGEVDKLYDAVDGDVRKTLKADDRVRDFAKKNGLDPDSIEVQRMTITNKRPGQVEVPKPGRDRDVTYQIVGKTPDGKVVKLDVDDKISKGVYEENFWKHTKGDLPMKGGKVDTDEVSRHAKDMDQTVTSKGHAEAYNPGEVSLDDFLDKGKTPTLTRIEDVRDTVTHKSHEWFESAGKAAKGGDASRAAKDTAEGMRQASKQWDDLMMSRFKQYGVDDRLKTVLIPPRLQKGMEIFQKVGKGEITPKQAEAMLEALSKGGAKVTPASIVDDMGHYLEALEKGPGNAYRVMKTADLKSSLSLVPNVGTAKWGDDSLDALNSALRNGEVTGETFRRMRAEVLQKMGQGPGWKEWLSHAIQRRAAGAHELEEMEREQR
ncbi:MAG: hypothetical protein HYY16_06375 [Planctomycetes bacterium]|nr:hypothetical protein [Planctomycetota bacterium]